jgi:hypothetical protein
MLLLKGRPKVITLSSFHCSANKTQFQFFSKVVANNAKLHRAVLRNWHHILMMIGNFAGTNIDTDSKWLRF